MATMTRAEPVRSQVRGTRRFFSVSHIHEGVPGLEPSSAALPGHQQGTGSEVEHMKTNWHLNGMPALQAGGLACYGRDHASPGIG